MKTARWWLVGMAVGAAACGPADRPVRSAGASVPGTVKATPAPPTREDLELQAQRLVQQGHELAQTNSAQADAVFERALAIWESLGPGATSVVATYDDVTTRPSAEVKVVASTRDGRLVAQAWGSSIAVFDAPAWRLASMLEGHQAQVTSLGFSADGRWLFSSASDGTIRRWDLSSATAAGVTGKLSAPSDVDLSPDGTTAVYRCGAHLCFWRASEPAPQERQVRPPEACAVVRHWLDAGTIVAGNDGEDLCLLDASTGGKKSGIPFLSGYLSFAVRAPTFLASVMMGESVRAEVWDGGTGRRLRTLSLERPDGQGRVLIQGPPVLSPDAHRAAAPTSSREVTFWNVETGAVERQMSTRVPVGNPTYLDDGSLFLPHIRGRSFDVLGLRDQEPWAAYTIPMLADPEVSSPRDAKAILLRTGSGLVAWSLETGNALPWRWANALPGPAGIRCSSVDGKLLAIASSNEVLVFDTAQGRVVLKHEVPAGSVVTAAGFLRESAPALVVVSSRLVAGERGGRPAGSADIVAFGEPAQRPISRKLDPHLGAQLADDGTALALVVAGKGVRILQLPSGRAGQTIPVAGPWALSPDGSAIAWSGRAPGAADAADALHEVVTATGVERTLPEAPSTRGPLAWSADGGRLAYGAADSGGTTVVAVDAATGRVGWRSALPGSAGLTDFVWAGDGRLVLARDKTGRVHVLSGKDGTYLFTWAVASDGQSWFATDASGRLEAGGPAGESMMACKVGMRILPYEVCRHRFARDGLVEEALRGH